MPGVGWRQVVVESALLFAFCAFVFWWTIGASAGPIEGDTLFHYKMSRLVLERGPWIPIDNLPYTVLGTHGTDHYWFFHVLVSPLTLLGNEVKDIQLATALLGAAVPAAINPFLRVARVPYAPLVSLLMISASVFFPYRFLLLRGQNFAVPMMVAMLFAMLGKRRWWAGIGAFFFMQGYHAAVILGLFCVLVALVHRYEDGRPDWKTPAAVFYGGALGLVASPWFPDNVRYLIFHTLFKVARAEQGVGLLGTEWFLPPWRELVTESWPAHLVFFAALGVGASLTARKRVRWSGAALASTAATLVFLGMYKFAGWRFGEYYVPFAVMSAALIWRDSLEAWGPRRDVPLRVPALVFAALVGWAFHRNLEVVHGLEVTPVSKYKTIMEYVEAHDPKPMVFNNRWWDYMVLFYHAKNAKFVAGMDGHFLQYGDPARFALWNAIIRAYPIENLAATIHDRFGARWAVIGRKDFPVVAALLRDKNARLVVDVEEGWLFELKADGQPWPSGLDVPGKPQRVSALADR
jgi:hypothetical protein